jgi:hypothetical protein
MNVQMNLSGQILVDGVFTNIRLKTHHVITIGESKVTLCKLVDFMDACLKGKYKNHEAE